MVQVGMIFSKRSYFLVAVAAVIVLMAVAGVWRFFASQGGAGDPRMAGFGGATPVIVATVTKETFSDRIEAIGTARANESVSITAKVTESVRLINFTDGQHVEAGDILVELTDSEQSAELDSARASLREAEQQYDRIADLVQRGSATRSRLDEVTAMRDRARANVAALEARLDDRLIRAPFSGALGLRQVSVGTLVRPGDVITTLDDVTVIKLDFSVPETVLANIAVGQTIEAVGAIDPTQTSTGQISVIDSRIDPVSRSAIVRAEIPNPDGALRPGMLMTVRVFANERVALTVPESALVPFENDVFVFRLTENMTVDRVKVRIGGRRPGQVEILEGLMEGDEVVVEGTHRLRPGSRVSVPDGEAQAGVPIGRQG
jgi:membrane fusion protein (multidrug efflux system)